MNELHDAWPNLDDCAIEEPELPDMGPCCICGSVDDVRNVIMLPRPAPVPGTGWGCVVCDLPSDGAVAVICDDCIGPWQRGEMKICQVCYGYPGNGQRVDIAEVEGHFEHDLSKHSDEEYT